MTVLLDTNILARAAQPGHVHHDAAVRATDVLDSRGDTPSLVPQVLYEFWAVATRPTDKHGLGFSTAEARTELSRIKRMFPLLPDVPAILPAWEELIAAYEVKGKSSHDARLVAAMRVHGINQILTINEQDFIRYPGITVLTPESILKTAGLAD